MEDDGDVVERYEYDVYGKPTIYNVDFSQTYDTSQHDNPVMFTGQRLDTLDSDNLQLMYYKNRHYCPDTGRFLQRDPLVVSPFDVQYDLSNGILSQESIMLLSLTSYDLENTYSYVFSNPIILVDPYGLWCDDECSRGSSRCIDVKLIFYYPGHYRVYGRGRLSSKISISVGCDSIKGTIEIGKVLQDALLKAIKQLGKKQSWAQRLLAGGGLLSMEQLLGMGVTVEAETTFNCCAEIDYCTLASIISKGWSTKSCWRWVWDGEKDEDEDNKHTLFRKITKATKKSDPGIIAPEHYGGVVSQKLSSLTRDILATTKILGNQARNKCRDEARKAMQKEHGQN